MTMRNKDIILEKLRQHTGETVSGEALASELGISRQAVWKSVQSLRDMGYIINSSGNNGYILDPENTVFTTESVEEILGKDVERLGIDLKVVDDVSSTNNALKEEAKRGAREGTVLIAKHQSAGKGRLGRRFFSPKHGIYMSFILRPKLSMHESMYLTTIAAVAVRDSIESVTGKDAGIKWVNDIYVDGKKISGILTEAEADIESQSLSFAIVGIGINVTDPDGGWPAEIKDVAGSIYGAVDCPPGAMARISAEVIRNYFEIYRRLPDRSFMKSYGDHQILKGKRISVIRRDGSIEATALGTDEDGRLLVRFDDGSETALFTGEVSVRLAGTEEMNKPVF